MNYKSFEQLANEGTLLKNKNADKTLTLFQYKTGISNWSDPTIRQSRGIVFDNDGRVVVRPYDKFFNYHQYRWLETENAENLSSNMTLLQKKEVQRMTEWEDNKPFRVEEKLDGSLMCVSVLNNELLVTASGSIDGEHSQYFYNMLKEKFSVVELEKLKEMIKGKTAIFEYIHPNIDPKVVEYDYKDIVLHGLIDVETGYDYAFETELEDLAQAFNFKRPYIYEDIQSEEDTLKKLETLEDENYEGFVVSFNMEKGVVKRLKFKTESYVSLHSAHGMINGNKPSLKGLMEVYKLIENDEIDDVLNKLSSNPFAIERVDKVKEVYDNFEEMKKRVLSDIQKYEEQYQSDIQSLLNDGSTRGQIIKNAKQQLDKSDVALYIRLLTFNANAKSEELKNEIAKLNYTNSRLLVMLRGRLKALRNEIKST